MQNVYKILKKIIKLFFSHPSKQINFFKLIICYFFQNSFVKTKPISLMIEPCNYCNLQCSSCPVGDKRIKKEKRIMTFVEFKKIIDEVGDYLFYIVLWNWGEPFLNKELPQMIKYAKEKNISVVTSTNGHYLDSNTARQIIDSKLDEIIIAVDGLSQKTYQKYRKGGNLNTVIKGIKNLVRLKEQLNAKYPKIRLQFLAMEHNEHELPKLKEFSNKLGVDVCVVKTYNKYYSESELDKFEPKNKQFSRYGVNYKKQYKCKQIYFGININSDGNVVPCCYDVFEEYKLGNIFKDGGVIKIWNSKELRDFRKYISKNRNNIVMCKECYYAKTKNVVNKW